MCIDWHTELCTTHVYNNTATTNTAQKSVVSSQELKNSFASSSSFQACLGGTCNTGCFEGYEDEPSSLTVCSSSARAGFPASVLVLTCTIFAEICLNS